MGWRTAIIIKKNNDSQIAIYFISEFRTCPGLLKIKFLGGN